MSGHDSPLGSADSPPVAPSLAHLAAEAGTPAQSAPATEDNKWAGLSESDVETLARSSLSQLTAASEALKSGDYTKQTQMTRVLQSAKAAIEQTADAFEALKMHPPLEQRWRQQLLDGYFRLRKISDATEQRLEGPRLTPQASPAVRTKTRGSNPAVPAARPRTRGSHLAVPALRVDAPVPFYRRRVSWLALAVVLGTGARLGFYAYEQSQLSTPPPEHKARHKGLVGAEVEGRGTVVRDLNKGVPVVSSVRLVLMPGGGLRAVAMVLDSSGGRPQLRYRWFQDEREVEVEEDGFLPPSKVKPLGAYRVEVLARSGPKVSVPLRTPPLVVPANVEGSAGGKS